MKIDFRVYLITDRGSCRGGNLTDLVEKALDGGVRAVQLREKELPAGELFRLAERMRRLTDRYGASLLVNDRADVALAVGADGVHLGVRSLPPRNARCILGARAVIGCSAHDEGELRDAEEGGADFATFGPVFATPSKARFGPAVGVSALAAACRGSRIPVFALGGVGPANLEEVARAGSFGIAVISAIAGARDPRGAAAALTGYFARGGSPAEAEKEGVR